MSPTTTPSLQSSQGASSLAMVDGESLRRAAALLRAGRLVAFPTETVYGLGADACNAAAVAAIFDAKARPSFNPLIVHVPDVAAAADLVVIDGLAATLADAFWPGPLSLVLPRRANCPVADIVSAGLDSLAIRVPGTAIAQSLLRAAGVPVAAPSANRSGQISPTTANHVREELGDAVDMILDGGPCSVGLESTVVGFTDGRPVMLRPGGLTREEIESVVGPLIEADNKIDATQARDGAPVTSPGQLNAHYAPAKPLRIGTEDLCAEDGLLAFGPQPPSGAGVMLNLSPTGDAREAAANLFSMLRQLDDAPITAIAVMTLPEFGLGCAINDRLRRAAQGRAPTKPT